MRLVVGTLAALALLAVSPSPSPATFPPRDCGFITVGAQRYNIKADIRCKKARKGSRQHLNGKGAPEGFSCTDYGGETAVEFRCERGARTFFAVRR